MRLDKSSLWLKLSLFLKVDLWLTKGRITSYHEIHFHSKKLKYFIELEFKYLDPYIFFEFNKCRCEGMRTSCVSALLSFLVTTRVFTSSDHPLNTMHTCTESRCLNNTCLGYICSVVITYTLISFCFPLHLREMDVIFFIKDDESKTQMI